MMELAEKKKQEEIEAQVRSRESDFVPSLQITQNSLECTGNHF